MSLVRKDLFRIINIGVIGIRIRKGIVYRYLLFSKKKNSERNIITGKVRVFSFVNMAERAKTKDKI